MRAAPLLACAALALSACGGASSSPPPPPPPPDTTPPAVEARPPGGTAHTAFYVTLVADEIATIEYTLDGSEPATGAPGTRHGTNPVFWLRFGDGTTTVRFRAIDAAGNASPVRSATYTVDTVPPVLTRLSPPPPPLALLDGTAVTWQASEPVAWTVVVQVGGTESHLGAGRAEAATPVTIPVPHGGLPAGTGQVVVRAQDDAGLAAELVTPITVLGVEPVRTFQTTQGQGGLALSPAGDRAFVLGGLAVYGVDLGAGPGFGAEAWSFTGLWYPRSLSLDPGGGRLWVGGLSALDGVPHRVEALDPATGLEVAAIPFAAGTAPGLLARTAGERLFVRREGVSGLVEYDVDPASPGYLSLLARHDGTGAGFTTLGLTLPSPDRRRLLLLHDAGRPDLAALLVTDPSDPAHGTITGTLAAQVPWQVPAAAWAPDGRGFALCGCGVGGSCALSWYDVATDTLSEWNPLHQSSALAFTPDGAWLLSAAYGTLYAIEVASLTARAGTPLGEFTVTAIQVSPDGADAWLVGLGPGTQDRLARVRLR